MSPTELTGARSDDEVLFADYVADVVEEFGRKCREAVSREER